mmetsp:Transcript_50418/g.117043  ORF Transcript_50418/g.117043 Transcript_50418/m.117043 type:complete len:285 (+) Transcript_50418:44-898(+)|eukprot:CAMPEP_0171062642 /NCGR_PEP_ID=MMETSP0766_2-20121228/5162_1 /TAXON_ID=439317 /ORGANISM="Gambierdiscus australes, Strain CAWD 149" /LENGTH=284 /DNA_ID=CAMNT_0011518443 /DNA_START=39 /DNA_END=893 /DNA_ORIENTATION=+
MVKAPLVNVLVTTLGGKSLFGPQCLDGEMTGAELKGSRELKGDLVGPLGVCREHDQLGQFGCLDLTLTLVVNALSSLTAECRTELARLGALSEFEGRPCVRICRATRVHESRGGSGFRDDEREFMLTCDGRVLAKRSEYFRWSDYSDQTHSENWRLTLAEGTFTVVDESTCTVVIAWDAEARRRDCLHYHLEDERPQGTRGCWQARAAAGSIIPDDQGEVKVLLVAKRWMGEPQADGAGHNQQAERVLRSIILAGVTAGVVRGLGMDPDNVAYWQHGELHRGLA